MTCLETTFMIDFLRGTADAVKRMQTLVESSESLTVTSPSVVEVATGAALTESPREREQLHDFLSRVTTLPLDQKTALIAGDLQAQLMKSGETIGHVDTTIGAIALVQGERLITRNMKHFTRIPRLEVEGY